MNSWQRLKRKLAYAEQRGKELEYVIVHGVVPPVTGEKVLTDITGGDCITIDHVREYLKRSTVPNAID